MVYTLRLFVYFSIVYFEHSRSRQMARRAPADPAIRSGAYFGVLARRTDRRYGL